MQGQERTTEERIADVSEPLRDLTDAPYDDQYTGPWMRKPTPPVQWSDDVAARDEVTRTLGRLAPIAKAAGMTVDQFADAAGFAYRTNDR
jgi:hypothetical protein